MAIAQQLADKLAQIANKPATVAINQLRNLRDAGLIAKAGRGASAAQMGVTDAVMLLLAMAGTERLKDSVDVVSSLKSLECVDRSQVWHRRSLRMPTYVLALPDGHLLADALRVAFGISGIAIGLEVDDPNAHDSLHLMWQHRPVSEIILDVTVNYPTLSAVVLIEIPRLVRETLFYGALAKSGAMEEFTRSCRFGRPTLDEINKLLRLD